MRRIDRDRMRKIAERVAIFRDGSRREDLEWKAHPALARSIERRQPHFIVRMRNRLLVDVPSDVFDAKSHASGSLIHSRRSSYIERTRDSTAIRSNRVAIRADDNFD